MTIAVYAGTFDPITTGHVAVIREAIRLFAHVRVLVAVHPTKKPMFSLQERVELATEVLAAMPTVSVRSTRGRVVGHAREVGATALVRGMRGAADASYETSLAQQNRELAPEIITVMLPSAPHLTRVSSTELKARCRRGEPIGEFCSEVVARALAERTSS